MSQDFQTSLSTTMERLKQALHVLVDALPVGAPIVYLDQPVHLNVGDLLINVGLEKLLADNGRKIVHRFSIKDYERFIHVVKDEHVLLLHGGGNMGDVWPRHESLRQNVIKRFTRNKILVFPQSAYFSEESKVEDCAAAYRAHPDCTIFLRDHKSFELVRQKFRVPCAMSPDTAHQLWQAGGVFMPAYGGEGELRLMRRDHESSTGDGTSGNAVDWNTIITPLQKAKYQMCNAMLQANGFLSLQPHLMRLWYAHRDHVVDHCATYFKGYARVKTDRLHGIIMSLLLGKEVEMKDNSYGKLSTYCAAWMPDLVKRID